MTPQDFIVILSQNPKVSEKFIEDAMCQNGWKRISVPEGVSFSDGRQVYYYRLRAVEKPRQENGYEAFIRMLNERRISEFPEDIAPSSDGLGSTFDIE